MPRTGGRLPMHRGETAQGFAAYLAGLLARLEAAGATIGILPAATPHFCIAERQAIAPIPVIDLTIVISDHLRNGTLSKSRYSDRLHRWRADRYDARRD